MAEKCPYECRQVEKFEKIATERGESLACLRSIDASLKEIKVDGRKDNDELWSAVNALRKDIQALYWRVGFIAGGSALVISIVVNFVRGALK